MAWKMIIGGEGGRGESEARLRLSEVSGGEERWQGRSEEKGIIGEGREEGR